MEGTTSSTPDSYSIYTTSDLFENFHRHLESLRQLMIKVQDNIFPLENSRRVPQEHMVVDQMKLLAKNSNFGKNDKDVMQGKILDKLPCNESFSKEQIGCHDPNLGEGHTSCELKEATPKSVLRLMGLKGLTLYHLKSHLQKYRLGQQAKKQNAAEQNRENIAAESFGQFSLHSSGPSITSSSMNGMQGEAPISEQLRCQFEVQKRLQEQLEVQQKLQMRIEAQGKYLQAILDKAQKSLSIDMTSPRAVDETKAQLTDFNTALSNLMDYMHGVNRDETAAGKRTQDDSNDYQQTSTYLMKEEQNNNMNIKVEETSVSFDLNSRSSYDFIGMNSDSLEAKPFPNGRLEI